ncbi:MAG: acetolactate decarboxylase [Dehalococcoidia bacterium]
MKKAYLATIAIVLLILATAAGCIDDTDKHTYQETLTQVSTIDALMNGIYDGVISHGELKKHGDFGVGTFEALDGEMLAFDGNFYQIKADGKVYKVDDSMMTPFAAVTFFDTDQTAALTKGMDYAQVGKFLDSLVPTENIFYAIKIEGTFEYIKTRSVPAQTKPYPPLAEVTKDQSVFEFQNVKGTIVGFRSPPYVKGINVPGYHLHFLTESGDAGGHLLELRVGEAKASLDYTSGFFMILPGEGSDFYKLDLSLDKEAELQKAEK